MSVRRVVVIGTSDKEITCCPHLHWSPPSGIKGEPFVHWHRESGRGRAMAIFPLTQWRAWALDGNVKHAVGVA